jgi:hypothetical protein
MTNEELIVDLMNFSHYGALMQAFMIEGLRRYAKQCIAAGPDALDTPYLSGRAWHGCAVELSEALASHLERSTAGGTGNAPAEPDEPYVVVLHPGTDSASEYSTHATAQAAYAAAEDARDQFGPGTADVAKRQPDGTTSFEF